MELHVVFQVTMSEKYTNKYCLDTYFIYEKLAIIAK